MTKLSLREVLGRLGPIRDIDRVQSGSPVDLVLRLERKLADVRTIDAALALAKRGLTMLRAKRVVEAVVEHGEAAAHVPTVEDITALVEELRHAGVKATRIARSTVDVKAVREDLGLSQEQFALRFNLDLDTVRNWEQGRNIPDRASTNYLRVVAKQPLQAAAAQEEEVS